MDEIVSIGISPGFQEIFLEPGETYSGSFDVINPNSNERSVNYEVFVAPLTISDEKYEAVFEDRNDFTQIVDWIEIDNSKGAITRNSTDTINFKVNVPSDAPAGGQYAALIVRIINEENESAGLSVSTTNQIAMLLYSTVNGETKNEGLVLENNINLFYLDSPIKTSSLVQNTGNIHTKSVSSLKIVSVFSGEEVYANDDSPDANTIIPETTFYAEKTWSDTPKLGLFRVTQEVTFAGDLSVVERTVLVCPAWFLFLVSAFAFSMIFWLISHIQERRKIKGLLKNS